MAQAQTLAQQLVAGGLAGALIYGVIAFFRFVLGKDKQKDAWVAAEFARLSARIKDVELGKDDCLRREAALMERVGKLESLVVMTGGGGPIAHVAATADGIIKEWNPGATSMFGWSKEEAVGQDVAILIPPHLRERHHNAFQLAVTEDRRPGSAADAPRVLESEALRRDGKVIPVTIFLSGWVDESKRYFSAEIRLR